MSACAADALDTLLRDMADAERLMKQAVDCPGSVAPVVKLPLRIVSIVGTPFGEAWDALLRAPQEERARSMARAPIVVPARCFPRWELPATPAQGEGQAEQLLAQVLMSGFDAPAEPNIAEGEGEADWLLAQCLQLPGSPPAHAAPGHIGTSRSHAGQLASSALGGDGSLDADSRSDLGAGADADVDAEASREGQAREDLTALTPETYATLQAAQEAEQHQLLQQYQFHTQMRLHEAAVAAQLRVDQPTSSRFKNDYRPMWMCKYMQLKGVCDRGDKCTFAHSLDELHMCSPNLPKIEGVDQTSLLADHGGKVWDDLSAPPELKLKKRVDLCDQWKQNKCLLGSVCQFAHGEHEIGTISLAVSGVVKTQICQSWKSGRCLYGSLCNRAHGEHEIGRKRPPPELTQSNSKKLRGTGSVFKSDRETATRGARS